MDNEVIIATSAEMSTALGWLSDIERTEGAKPEAERDMHLWRMAHAAVTLILPMVANDQHMIWFQKRWRVPSSKSGWYMASEERCACEAGQHGQECKHMLIAASLNAAHWPSAEVEIQSETITTPDNDDCPF